MKNVPIYIIFVLGKKTIPGNGASKSYVLVLSIVFGMLFIVIVLVIVFIVFKKRQSNEENTSLKIVDKGSYKTLD